MTDRESQSTKDEDSLRSGPFTTPHFKTLRRGLHSSPQMFAASRPARSHVLFPAAPGSFCIGRRKKGKQQNVHALPPDSTSDHEHKKRDRLARQSPSCSRTFFSFKAKKSRYKANVSQVNLSFPCQTHLVEYSLPFFSLLFLNVFLRLPASQGHGSVLANAHGPLLREAPFFWIGSSWGLFFWMPRNACSPTVISLARRSSFSRST